jgi:predicted lipid-binding transport protein (Tim44 family)
MREIYSWQTTSQEYLQYLEQLIAEAQATRDLVSRINHLPLPVAELDRLNAQRKQEAAVALAYYGVRDRLFTLITAQPSSQEESSASHGQGSSPLEAC